MDGAGKILYAYSNRNRSFKPLSVERAASAKRSTESRRAEPGIELS